MNVWKLSLLTGGKRGERNAKQKQNASCRLKSDGIKNISTVGVREETEWWVVWMMMEKTFKSNQVWACFTLGEDDQKTRPRKFYAERDDRRELTIQSQVVQNDGLAERINSIKQRNEFLCIEQQKTAAPTQNNVFVIE